jgi:dihydroxyacetone kinase DhaKLM complex PTS-EIIA-like component DhaM
MAHLDYSTALESKRLIVTHSSVIRSVLVYNDGPDQFLHVYDLGSATVSGTPVAIIPMPADSTIALDTILRDVAFANGVLLANTTTSVTYTAGADDCWFTVVYD